MKLNDSDKSKVLILVCGIVGVAGLIMVRFNGMSAPAPETGVVASMESTEGQRSQTIFASNETTLITLPPDSPVTSINPFRRILPDPNGTPSRPSPQVTVTAMPAASNFPKLQSEFKSSGTLIMPARLDSPELAAMEIKPNITLDGVLTGSEPVAVLKIGTSTQVVGLGQMVLGYTVKAISDTSVKLQRDKEILVLSLGRS